MLLAFTPLTDVGHTAGHWLAEQRAAPSAGQGKAASMGREGNFSRQRRSEKTLTPHPHPQQQKRLSASLHLFPPKAQGILPEALAWTRTLRMGI